MNKTRQQKSRDSRLARLARSIAICTHRSMFLEIFNISVWGNLISKDRYKPSRIAVEARWAVEMGCRDNHGLSKTVE